MTKLAMQPASALVLVAVAGGMALSTGIVLRAAPDTTMSVDPPAQTAAPDGSSSFSVTITDATDAAGAGFRINFDPNIVRIDARPGVPEFPAGCNVQVDVIRNDTGLLDFACVTTPLTGSDGGGLVARYDFTCLREGVSSLDLKRTELIDSGAGLLPHTAAPGSITCGLPASPTPTPTDTNTPGSTPTATPKDAGGDTDGDTIPNDSDSDDDSDGCTDEQENGPNPALGGRRNPHHFWDFYDTPNPSGNVRDQVIDIGDLFRVVDRFGTFTDPPPSKAAAFTEARLPPPPAGYHAAYDRSPPSSGSDPWDLGPPDGTVDIGDIFAAVAQFGHSCG